MKEEKFDFSEIANTANGTYVFENNECYAGGRESLNTKWEVEVLEEHDSYYILQGTIISSEKYVHGLSVEIEFDREGAEIDELDVEMQILSEFNNN